MPLFTLFSMFLRSFLLFFLFPHPLFLFLHVLSKISSAEIDKPTLVSCTAFRRWVTCDLVRDDLLCVPAGPTFKDSSPTSCTLLPLRSAHCPLSSSGVTLIRYWLKYLASFNPLRIFNCDSSVTVTSYCYFKCI